jgi:ABC-type glycerol-3-phosphate transport system permease component
VVERESLQQIMQVIYSFKPSRDPNWPLIMLASTIATMIPLTIYLIFNKQIVESLKISGIK